MKFLYFADPHLQPKGPPSRKDDYAETILWKLAQISVIAKREKVDQVFCLGDLFHHKDPNRTPPWLLVRTMEVLSTFGPPVFMVMGNHDLQSAGPATVPRQPVGVLIQAGLLYYQEEPYEIDNFLFHPFHHLPKMKDALRHHTPAISAEHKNILLTHADISPTGRFETVAYSEMVNWGYDYIFYGHMHELLPVHMLMKPKIICVPAVARGSIPTTDTRTPPAIVIHDTDDDGFRFIELEHMPQEDLFRFEEHELKKITKRELEQFVATADSLQLNTTSIASALAQIKGELDTGVYSILVEYLEDL